MIGGVIGALLLILLTPLAARASLLIQTPGKFPLVRFALVVICNAQRDAIPKATVAMLLGLMIATIGVDAMEPVARFTFGSELLVEGVDMMPLIIGTFAVSEVLTQVAEREDKRLFRLKDGSLPQISRRDFIPPLSEIRAIGWFTYLKSAIIGWFIGVLPGAGGSMAAFVSYVEAQRRSRHPRSEEHTSELQSLMRISYAVL